MTDDPIDRVAYDVQDLTTELKVYRSASPSARRPWPDFVRSLWGKTFARRLREEERMGESDVDVEHGGRGVPRKKFGQPAERMLKGIAGSRHEWPTASSAI